MTPPDFPFSQLLEKYNLPSRKIRFAILSNEIISNVLNIYLVLARGICSSIQKQLQEAEVQREFLARSDQIVDLTISGSKDSLHCGNETIMIANATHLVENID